MELVEATASTEALTDRVAALLRAGKLAVARPLLAAVRRRAQPSPRLAELAAHLALLEGRADTALAELDEAVTQHPDAAKLRKCRADVRLHLQDIAGAAADAAEAVILQPDDPAAKALLGILMLQLGRAGDAVSCLREAVATDTANPGYREALAAAQEADGDADAALATLKAGIALAPQQVSLRNAAVLLSVRRRDFISACSDSEAARAAGVADACCFGLMGHALSSLGRHAEAADAYTEALKLGPDDPYVRHLVAAAGLRPSATCAPVEYLRAVFDGYAERFEHHLISLGYRVPGLVRSAVLSHPVIAAGEPLGPALDLGCGTGLLAVALYDLPISPLVGVDVSTRMLGCAEAKQRYSELHPVELMEFLSGNDTEWQLILAADVLIYFGDLAALMRAVHDRLAPGGWFVFSLEELLPDHDGTLYGNGDWALERMGRFAHSLAYVASVAVDAGFSVRTLTREALRYEANAPVAGIFAVLERAGHGV